MSNLRRSLGPLGPVSRADPPRTDPSWERTPQESGSQSPRGEAVFRLKFAAHLAGVPERSCTCENKRNQNLDVLPLLNPSCWVRESGKPWARSMTGKLSTDIAHFTFYPPSFHRTLLQGRRRFHSETSPLMTSHPPPSPELRLFGACDLPQCITCQRFKSLCERRQRLATH